MRQIWHSFVIQQQNTKDKNCERLDKQVTKTWSHVKQSNRRTASRGRGNRDRVPAVPLPRGERCKTPRREVATGGSDRCHPYLWRPRTPGRIGTAVKTSPPPHGLSRRQRREVETGSRTPETSALVPALAAGREGPTRQ